MRRVYLDHSATTPVRPEVLEAMLPFLKDEAFGNPSTVYSYGREAKKALEEAREKVANLIGARPEEIFFTSGGTEADNLALIGTAAANEKKGRHIITSSIEHHAVLHTAQYLLRHGFKVTFLPVTPEGLVRVEDVEKAITDETILISVMHVNNEVGTIQPIKEIGKLARERGIIFHTDAVQSVGKLPVNVDELGVDLLSASGHKIYGPKGIGCLYIRKGTKINPILYGGAQERKRRPGTENMPGIVGFGRAAELAGQELESEMERLQALRDKLIDGILTRIEDVQLNGDPRQRVATNANFSFRYCEGESILLSLDMKGICASSGSACTSGSLDPSHVLLAMGIPHEVAHGSVRMTLGRENTEEDIDYVLEVMPEIIARLRSMSPLYEEAAGKR
ncbi:cysteine desulfurase IscS [Moorella thermoacetica]|uniref:Cysteine desulfurase IscS n=1 Tax=Moorella thermoacetica (strain ATCC 39073 / JCM 9320) TaxID=264732 RepID=Q2RHY5_MOOTA|nr:cysteine desulfurase NifS [Moorella thermoacetica]AKX94452.1 cysteine desulfurase IscS [Moorella thermoacetica]AKX97088.1 cysteine desulfurase IscS [Moorella thermoacetica]OIQ57493.1 cysteine desulfurase IscS [Moorella thermoacetica]QDA00918.1 Cysteine desulfurase [Moorella thermoacetica]TYL10075.1 Cysteine desulfurase IscS [Moorella thermoacetica]